MDVGYL
jgi:hypothetical protein